MLDPAPERHAALVPDRAPDGQARTRERPADLPCSYCGRTAAANLSLHEAHARHGYSRTDCMFCLLTDLRR